MAKFSHYIKKYLTQTRWLYTLMLWTLLLSSSLLFLPASIINQLGLSGLQQSQQHFIGLSLLISAAYFLAKLCDHLLDAGIEHYSEKRINAVIDEKINFFDAYERALLREFFLQSSPILSLPMDNLAVQSLTKAHIIECIGNEQHFAIQSATADYKITLQARRKLNRKILRLPEGTPNELELQRLIKSRPAFINNLSSTRKQVA
ncbi:hypothetical protein D5018_06255 [Parashewanella curva]|uniref:Superinfection exclusion protein B n=1 Tax=Parashewanella curva TaxID=2338552 RepID=A0A3L8PYU0_9GAMM|nr:superinfection exclusion B family protein [Parashewanella curva]RLV60547.1 hypothetical protein D5018_06255 [Parashewanella curva]